ncbi:Sulfate transporter/antisigma-factor antagonist STAS [Coriobacterium glomerans PW2]|uniref:Anti-sigma factor antagonist n=1 Tax=Coriobacterium glomerans (strain ATCC 49209 / DSM 20642 / JCM 10262 / PW2) TaxID=700015 RepID=F2N8G0_CORGP|nr:anti-sigma factor antagonist [Coriobacterium glomerans]AEB07343.1 Sulfate transporter/antisigma-factor antagonist STAS [Coriobacterium glomerans PW2]
MDGWNDIAVIAPAGDIDIATVSLLRSEIDNYVKSGIRRILLNCEHVGFIDSTGLAFLLACARSLMHAGGLLTLENASPEIIRFLQRAQPLDVLHVTAAHRLPIPVASQDQSPLWSKAIVVQKGIENLSYYRHRAIDILSDLPMGYDARLDTVSALGEALSNAYDHADCDGVTMTIRAYVDRVVVEVLDCGEGYEIGADEEPDVTEERGRGIRLMRMLVDSVEVHRRTDARGTLVRLIKLLSTVET